MPFNPLIQVRQQNGEIIEIPQDEAIRQIKSREAIPEPNQTFNLQDSNGTPISVSSDDPNFISIIGAAGTPGSTDTNIVEQVSVPGEDTVFAEDPLTSFPTEHFENAPLRFTPEESPTVQQTLRIRGAAGNISRVPLTDAMRFIQEGSATALPGQTFTLRFRSTGRDEVLNTSDTDATVMHNIATLFAAPGQGNSNTQFTLPPRGRITIDDGIISPQQTPEQLQEEAPVQPPGGNPEQNSAVLNPTLTHTANNITSASPPEDILGFINNLVTSTGIRRGVPIRIVNEDNGSLSLAIKTPHWFLSHPEQFDALRSSIIHPDSPTNIALATDREISSLRRDLSVGDPVADRQVELARAALDAWRAAGHSGRDSDSDMSSFLQTPEVQALIQHNLTSQSSRNIVRWINNNTGEVESARANPRNREERIVLYNGILRLVGGQVAPLNRIITESVNRRINAGRLDSYSRTTIPAITTSNRITDVNNMSETQALTFLSDPTIAGLVSDNALATNQNDKFYYLDEQRNIQSVDSSDFMSVSRIIAQSAQANSPVHLLGDAEAQFIRGNSIVAANHEYAITQDITRLSDSAREAALEEGYETIIGAETDGNGNLVQVYQPEEVNYHLHPLETFAYQATNMLLLGSPSRLATGQSNIADRALARLNPFRILVEAVPGQSLSDNIPESNEGITRIVNSEGQQVGTETNQILNREFARSPYSSLAGQLSGLVLQQTILSRAGLLGPLALSRIGSLELSTGNALRAASVAGNAGRLIERLKQARLLSKALVFQSLGVGGRIANAPQLIQLASGRGLATLAARTSSSGFVARNLLRLGPVAVRGTAEGAQFGVIQTIINTSIDPSLDTTTELTTQVPVNAGFGLALSLGFHLAGQAAVNLYRRSLRPGMPVTTPGEFSQANESVNSLVGQYDSRLIAGGAEQVSAGERESIASLLSGDFSAQRLRNSFLDREGFLKSASRDSTTDLNVLLDRVNQLEENLNSVDLDQQIADRLSIQIDDLVATPSMQFHGTNLEYSRATNFKFLQHPQAIVDRLKRLLLVGDASTGAEGIITELGDAVDSIRSHPGFEQHADELEAIINRLSESSSQGTTEGQRIASMYLGYRAAVRELEVFKNTLSAATTDSNSSLLLRASQNTVREVSDSLQRTLADRNTFQLAHIPEELSNAITEMRTARANLEPLLEGGIFSENKIKELLSRLGRQESSDSLRRLNTFYRSVRRVNRAIENPGEITSLDTGVTRVEAGRGLPGFMMSGPNSERVRIARELSEQLKKTDQLGIEHTVNDIDNAALIAEGNQSVADGLSITSPGYLDSLEWLHSIQARALQPIKSFERNIVRSVADGSLSKTTVSTRQQQRVLNSLTRVSEITGLSSQEVARIADAAFRSPSRNISDIMFNLPGVSEETVRKVLSRIHFIDPAYSTWHEAIILNHLEALNTRATIPGVPGVEARLVESVNTGITKFKDLRGAVRSWSQVRGIVDLASMTTRTLARGSGNVVKEVFRPLESPYEFTRAFLQRRYARGITATDLQELISEIDKTRVTPKFVEEAIVAETRMDDAIKRLSALRRVINDIKIKESRLASTDILAAAAANNVERAAIRDFNRLYDTVVQKNRIQNIGVLTPEGEVIPSRRIQAQELERQANVQVSEAEAARNSSLDISVQANIMNQSLNKIEQLAGDYSAQLERATEISPTVVDEWKNSVLEIMPRTPNAATTAATDRIANGLSSEIDQAFQNLSSSVHSLSADSAPSMSWVIRKVYVPTNEEVIRLFESLTPEEIEQLGGRIVVNKLEAATKIIMENNIVSQTFQVMENLRKLSGTEVYNQMLAEANRFSAAMNSLSAADRGTFVLSVEQQESRTLINKLVSDPASFINDMLSTNSYITVPGLSSNTSVALEEAAANANRIHREMTAALQASELRRSLVVKQVQGSLSEAEIANNEYLNLHDLSIEFQVRRGILHQSELEVRRNRALAKRISVLKKKLEDVSRTANVMREASPSSLDGPYRAYILSREFSLTHRLTRMAVMGNAVLNTETSPIPTLYEYFLDIGSATQEHVSSYLNTHMNLILNSLRNEYRADFTNQAPGRPFGVDLNTSPSPFANVPQTSLERGRYIQYMLETHGQAHTGDYTNAEMEAFYSDQELATEPQSIITHILEGNVTEHDLNTLFITQPAFLGMFQQVAREMLANEQQSENADVGMINALQTVIDFDESNHLIEGAPDNQIDPRLMQIFGEQQQQQQAGGTGNPLSPDSNNNDVVLRTRPNLPTNIGNGSEPGRGPTAAQSRAIEDIPSGQTEQQRLDARNR